ncbi:exopolysaccharide biosynthesis protein [Rhodovarius crocodyli]|uniref:Exopolysaccharide biosynthesis protein n=2 Tax=Rhodovarius crocodyli TaxID=1979269 RepID=A0A437MMF7_9PROT|nr:exopolysaccharide biosynthesis protein [Rhodovarius crocodyli]
MTTPHGTPTGPDDTHASEHESAPISRIVREVADRFPGERITLGDMADAFGDRAFGLLILLLCLPSLLPGMASVFGLPMLILGLQMGLGRRVPKLPGFIARQSIKRSDLLRLSDGGSKWITRIENFVKPRPGPFTGPLADKVVGWLTVYTALMLILPGPGTNGPPAFGNIVMALGVVENDSRVTGWGILACVLGNVFATVVLGALALVAIKALGWMI